MELAFVILPIISTGLVGLEKVVIIVYWLKSAYWDVNNAILNF